MKTMDSLRPAFISHFTAAIQRPLFSACDLLNSRMAIQTRGSQLSKFGSLKRCFLSNFHDRSSNADYLLQSKWNHLFKFEFLANQASLGNRIENVWSGSGFDGRRMESKPIRSADSGCKTADAYLMDGVHLGSCWKSLLEELARSCRIPNN